MFNVKFDVVIPLGSDCGCAQNCKDFKLRYYSYPFDWLFKISFDNRIKLIENHFEEFLVKENLKLLTKNPNATLVDRENDYYQDCKYGTQFLHDFISGLNFDLSFYNVKDKYDRRIDRMYEDIERAQKVLFVWKDKESVLENSVLQKAYDVLIKTFPDTEIFLLIIENNKAVDEIIAEDWISSHILRLSAPLMREDGSKVHPVNGNKHVNKLIFNKIKCKKPSFSFRVWILEKYIRCFCMVIYPSKKRKLIRAYLNSQLLAVSGRR